MREDMAAFLASADLKEDFFADRMVLGGSFPADRLERRVITLARAIGRNFPALVVGFIEPGKQALECVIGAILNFVDKLQRVQLSAAAFEGPSARQNVLDDLFDAPLRVAAAGLHRIAGLLGLAARRHAFEVEHGLGGLHTNDVFAEDLVAILRQPNEQRGTVRAGLAGLSLDLFFICFPTVAKPRREQPGQCPREPPTQSGIGSDGVFGWRPAEG